DGNAEDRVRRIADPGSGRYREPSRGPEEIGRSVRAPRKNLCDLLEIRVPRRARKRDHVADVAHSRRVHDGPLQSETETRVRHGSIPPQIAVPPVDLRIETELGQPAIQR